ncbi:uncharacterized protein G2W53_017909 [Senna tora]|uniref:Uncharacterized protein n=3 Tax=Senna tora TaxID=362788 RepID=A0A834WKK7_9FABA|nr:uncharacterized protein G2W53_017909 [Senna tora]
MGGLWSKVREGSREKNTTERKRKWQGKLQRGAEVKGESNLSKYRSGKVYIIIDCEYKI